MELDWPVTFHVVQQTLHSYQPQPLRANANTALLIAKIKSHPNDVVLVIGHSNTVPAILKALTGVDVSIADNEYDNLFVVVPSTGTMTRIRH
jgi:hypothetical protein